MSRPSERTPRSERSAANERERPVRPRGTAKDRALRLLGVRDRSRRELERRLQQAGFEPKDIEEALDALAGAGLIDDERFAAAVVEHAAGVKLSGRRAVMSSLLAKGINRATAEEAVERMVGDEEARARALAERQARRFRGLDPAVGIRRLSGLLLRRGFDPSTAFAEARRALGETPEET